MITIRESILNALQVRAAALASGEVYRCQPYVDEDEFIGLWDIEENAEKVSYNRSRMELSVGFIYTLRYTDTDAPTRGNQMLGDLVKTIAGTDSTLGGLCESCSYVSSAMRYPEPGSEYISVAAEFSVVYQTAAGDPFTAA